jgi:lipoate-protein ligase A
MALDEALLEAGTQIGKPLLRLYEWTEAAATFGYFQKFAEVQRMSRLRPLVRRPTGGGLVPHDADWTYSLVFPPAEPWYLLKAVESYRRLHQWIQAAFRTTGISTELSPDSRPDSPGECFVGAEKLDVLWQARKVAGAAQRRTRHALLIQGSIQPPPGLARGEWEEALCVSAREQWGVGWQSFEVTADLQRRVQELARRKYGSAEYTERR